MKKKRGGGLLEESEPSNGNVNVGDEIVKQPIQTRKIWLLAWRISNLRKEAKIRSYATLAITLDGLV
jgi:hypothetical protein